MKELEISHHMGSFQRFPNLTALLFILLRLPPSRENPKRGAGHLHEVQRHMMVASLLELVPAIHKLSLCLQWLWMLMWHVRKGCLVPWAHIVPATTVGEELPSKDSSTVLCYQFSECSAGSRREVSTWNPRGGLGWQKRVSTTWRSWYIGESAAHHCVFCQGIEYKNFTINYWSAQRWSLWSSSASRSFKPSYNKFFWIIKE